MTMTSLCKILNAKSALLALTDDEYAELKRQLRGEASPETLIVVDREAGLAAHMN